MLHEFALDPATFKDLKDARYLSDSFGFEHGRLIAKFPKKWMLLVYESCRDCPPLEKSRIEIILSRMQSKLLSSNRPYDPQGSWLGNASSEHKRRAFRAIIANSNPDGDGSVLTVDQLDAGLDVWCVPTGVQVRREISDLSSCLGPLLSWCKEILFVDPYFSPFDRRWRDIFIEYLKEIYSAARPVRRVEVHLDASDRPNRGAPTCESFRDALTTRYSGYPAFVERMPPDSEVLFVRWKQMASGERLHDRFVLTECGGVSIPGGLDPGQIGESTDINLLSPAVYLRRWNDYQADASGFRPEHEGQAFRPAFELVDRIRAGGGKATIIA